MCSEFNHTSRTGIREPSQRAPAEARPSSTRHRRAAALLLASLLGAAPACHSPSANYQPPAAGAAPTAFHHGSAAPGAGTQLPPSTPWWRLFNDPQLDALQAAATTQSPTLAGAAARLSEARARLAFATGDTQLSANLNANSRLIGESSERSLPLPGHPVTYRDAGDNYHVGIDASYEFDFWGRVKRSIESATAQVEASQADLETASLSLSAEIAQTYLTIRALQDEFQLLNDNIALRRDQLALHESRFRAGLSNSLDADRTRLDLANQEADAADLLRRKEAAVDALRSLVGDPGLKEPVPIGSSPIEGEATSEPVPTSELAAKQPVPFSQRGPVPTSSLQPVPLRLSEPVPIPVGLPSELLRRRPDIRAAERTLAARHAEIGVAQAAFFPSLRLTGSAGLESGDLFRLVSRPSEFWQFGPSLSLPIFNGGKNDANLAIAKARYEAAQAAYAQSVLTAFRDVDDALNDLQGLQSQREALQRAHAAAASVVHLSETRQQKGIISYFEVIEARKALLANERTQIQITQAQRLATVRLIKALGGQW